LLDDAVESDGDDSLDVDDGVDDADELVELEGKASAFGTVCDMVCSLKS